MPPSPTDEVRDLFDLIEKLLEFEPNDRLPLKHALKHPFFEKLTKHEKSPISDRSRSHSLSR